MPGGKGPTLPAQVRTKSNSSRTSGAVLKPSVRSSSAAARRYPICGEVGYYQRADVDGRVKKPKLDKDDAKMKELFYYCRAANFREVRAIAVHYPYLLSLTDPHGFSALHHAAMCGDPAFLSQVLELYRDPKTHSLKVVMYESEEELLSDIARGFKVINAAMPDEELPQARVSAPGQDAKAAVAGIMPGDSLEVISGPTILSYRQPPPMVPDILDALRSGRTTSFGFPVSLDFRGSAAAEILGRDGWTPAHAAAGRGGRGDRQILMQLLSEQDQAQLVKDISGCTPGHWCYIEKRASAHSHRRPLSAGPCGLSGPRRPIEAKWQKEEAAALLRPQSAAGTRPSHKAPVAVEKKASSATSSAIPAISRPVTPQPNSSGTFEVKGLAALLTSLNQPRPQVR